MPPYLADVGLGNGGLSVCLRYGLYYYCLSTRIHLFAFATVQGTKTPWIRPALQNIMLEDIHLGCTYVLNTTGQPMRLCDPNIRGSVTWAATVEPGIERIRGTVPGCSKAGSRGAACNGHFGCRLTDVMGASTAA